MEDNLKKNKNGRRAQRTPKNNGLKKKCRTTTREKMEDDLQKNGRQLKKKIKNGRQPQKNKN
jgi:hypothetical protein